MTADRDHHHDPHHPHHPPGPHDSHDPPEQHDAHWIATRFDRLADHLDNRFDAVTRHLKRMDQNMADLASAVAALQGEQDEVITALDDLAAKVAAAPNVQAAADAVQSVSDALKAAVGRDTTPPTPA